MCTATVLKVAHCQRCAGKADSVGASSEANRLARLPSSFWNRRSLSEGSNAARTASAAWTSARTVCRNLAISHLSTTCTADSALAFE